MFNWTNVGMSLNNARERLRLDVIHAATRVRGQLTLPVRLNGKEAIRMSRKPSQNSPKKKVF